jgi:hypothetical protein
LVSKSKREKISCVCLPPSLFECCVKQLGERVIPHRWALISTVLERDAQDRDFLLLCAALTFSFLSKLKISDNQALAEKRKWERERLTGINLAEATAKLFDLFEFLRRRGDTNKTFSGSILLATPFL